MVKKICNALSTVIVVLLVLLVVLLHGGRLFGFRTYQVLSPSMKPDYPTGSLVYVKAVPAQDIKAGDVISFYISGSTVATHRVVEIREEENKFITKGDANAINDAPTSMDKLIGKVVFCIPFLGFVAAFMATTTGKCVIAAVFAAAVILILLPELLKERKK